MFVIMRRNPRLCSTTLVICVLLLGTAVVRADSLDDRLQMMSTAELANLERDLRAQVEQHDRELNDMKVETERLKKEQKLVDDEADRLLGAKQWELNEKARREKELEAAKEDVLAKQASISKMNAEVVNLKDHIDSLESRLKQLTLDKEVSEKRFKDPSLADVLESRSHHWGNVTKHVYQKTMTEVVPVISDISERAQHMRHRVSRTSRLLEILVSLVIYGFVIVSIIACYRMYTKVRGNLTIARMLFIGDAFCACFWTIMLLCFMILFEDPLYVMRQRSPAFFFVFQLVACFSYVNFVLLRVLVLASKMTLGALGETLAVVVVGQHYYVRVWQPAMMDRPFRGTFFYYFCYAWLFSAFAYNRIQEFAPLKQLRGPRLPLHIWLGVLFARFTNRNVPDGDIESSPYAPDEENNHEH